MMESPIQYQTPLTHIENREGTIQSIVIDVVNQSDDSFAYNDDGLLCVVVAEDPDNT